MISSSKKMKKQEHTKIRNQENKKTNKHGKENIRNEDEWKTESNKLR